jgi:hypothetical protein
MILHFPNHDTLSLALTSGAVPGAVSLSSVQAVFDAEGQTWVAPSVPLDKAALADLGRLGVEIDGKAETLATGVVNQIHAWPQLLPLERDSRPWDQSDRTPILFALNGAGQMPELVGELLRLGNDRQSFRWLEKDRALLRVVGPPYYSLLRALDGQGSAMAYRERHPGVWVQIGFLHPLIEHIQPPAGQVLLMDYPRHWTFIDEGRFRDIYEILDFALLQAPAAWHETDLERRLTIPVRLTRGGTGNEPTELWVLKDNDLAQLDNLVQNADDQLLARLAFAVGEGNGQRTTVLRARPSKLPPPVLVLECIGFRPYLRLPNLFLPCGQRLHPPLRRDAVIKLLAKDARQITWLYPQADGQFIPETLPDEAFRPLSQWVDYVLDHDHQALTAWVEATRFDFESFICPDDQPARKHAPKEPTRPKKPRSDNDEDTEESRKGPAIEAVNKSRKRKKEAPVDEIVVPSKPSEMEQILRGLEQSFLELKVPLDAPERQDLWPRMAQLNSALGHGDDAAVCWGNAMWERESPPSAWLETWWQADLEHSGLKPAPEQLRAILGMEFPKPADVRRLAFLLLSFAQEKKPPANLAPLLGRAQKYLENHETLLGVRLAWLAWEALHRLAGGDVLALARARDRLLERLCLGGLSADLDLPGFLRFTGLKSSDRFRLVREQIVRLRPMVHQWITKDYMPVPATAYYLDLVFAFGLARLGETSECVKLVEKSKQEMQAKDIVHSWLFQAFEYRIRQALGGKASTGPLPQEMLESLEARERFDHLGLDAATLKKYKDQVKLERYKIDRLRQNSRILEPHEKVEPYRRWHGQYADDLSRELAGLFDIHDRGKLAERLKKLLFPKGKDKKPVEARILATALELAPRLGEEFSEILLERVEDALEKMAEALDQALVLEKGLFLAAHYDKHEEVQNLVGRFHTLLEGKGSSLPVKNLESLLGNSFRSLRKLGLRAEVSKLLEVIEKNPEMEITSKGASSTNAVRRRCMLLQIAGGWFYFGQDDRGRPILDKARATLFKGDLIPVDQTTLACAYVATLGQAPMDLALPRIIELFRKLKGVFDSYTTTSHYSLTRLNVAEAVIFALVNDDFTITPEARRWLDDDEFLVRRRIHREVRRAMEKTGE